MIISTVLEIVQNQQKINTNWPAINLFGIKMTAVLACSRGTEGSEICSPFEHSLVAQVVLYTKGDYTHLYTNKGCRNMEQTAANTQGKDI